MTSRSISRASSLMPGSRLRLAVAGALCKEFVFSVQDGDGPNAHEDCYTASACQQEKGWKWASAEPTVERWGNLQ